MTNLLIRYIPYIFDIFLLLLLLLLLLRLLARCLCGVHLKFWLRLGMASLSFQTISHIRAATHISNATTTKLYAFRFQDMFSVHRSMRKKYWQFSLSLLHSGKKKNDVPKRTKTLTSIDTQPKNKPNGWNLHHHSPSSPTALSLTHTERGSPSTWAHEKRIIAQR